MLGSESIASLERTGGEDGLEFFVDVFKPVLHDAIEGNLNGSSKSIGVDHPACCGAVQRPGRVAAPCVLRRAMGLGLSTTDSITAIDEEVLIMQALSIFALLRKGNAVAAVTDRDDKSSDGILEGLQGHLCLVSRRGDSARVTHL